MRALCWQRGHKVFFAARLVGEQSCWLLCWKVCGSRSSHPCVCLARTSPLQLQHSRSSFQRSYLLQASCRCIRLDVLHMLGLVERYWKWGRWAAYQSQEQNRRQLSCTWTRFDEEVSVMFDTIFWVQMQRAGLQTFILKWRVDGLLLDLFASMTHQPAPNTTFIWVCHLCLTQQPKMGCVPIPRAK